MKPYGIYSDGLGIPCSFDPIDCNLSDSLWQPFSKEYNRLAIDTLGANSPLIQTQWLQPGDVHISRKLTRGRCVTESQSIIWFSKSIQFPANWIIRDRSGLTISDK